MIMQDRSRVIAGTKYDIAQELQGLKSLLAQYMRSMTKEQQFILYKIGEQESLMRVDFSKQPYQVYYNDKLGRPAPFALKIAVTEIMSELNKPFQFNDMHALMLSKKVHDTIGGTSDAPPATLEFAHHALLTAWGKSQISKVGMFAHHPVSETDSPKKAPVTDVNTFKSR